MEAVTWGFIGTIVGALASIATTALTNWNSHVLSNRAKESEKQNAANTFQRETILELQVALLDYFRSCCQIYRYDLIILKKTGKWHQSVPEELNDINRTLTAKISILIQRISDDELRTSLKAFKSICTQFGLAENDREASMYHMQALSDYENVNELLGQALRTTYL
ncbi:hypothetical protein [Photobacterium damselae]|uniref:Uncharacterized protein n=1 Tax=Photobacterium damselae subsp. damselae TaxID=85581 RepID=A0AAD3WV46_PHODD|nr:hypothetical protein [Photobacterium damselae]KAB1179944.1 hypothetical protein F6450_12225 [Photobacterium damselae subsp. damselae]